MYLHINNICDVDGYVYVQHKNAVNLLLIFTYKIIWPIWPAQLVWYHTPTERY